MASAQSSSSLTEERSELGQVYRLVAQLEERLSSVCSSTGLLGVTEPSVLLPLLPAPSPLDPNDGETWFAMRLSSSLAADCSAPGLAEVSLAQLAEQFGAMVIDFASIGSGTSLVGNAIAGLAIDAGIDSLEILAADDRPDEDFLGLDFDFISVQHCFDESIGFSLQASRGKGCGFLGVVISHVTLTL